CPAPAARTVGHFTLSLEAKSASSSRVPMPSLVLNEPLALFFVQLQRLDCSVASLLPARQKAPLVQEFQCPLVLSKPLLLSFAKINRKQHENNEYTIY
ncbi:hypothetical protein, partial [Bacillus wiedmannii]|uniref:hypothetical protein n=1 Tax=Bacillus wiedmannii TaxID=1890302 RepID=UPI001C5591DD